MEEDKRKKRNRKKKNKQASTPTESVMLDAGEPNADNQTHNQAIGQCTNGQVSGTVDATSDVEGKTNLDGVEHITHGNEEPVHDFSHPLNGNIAKAEKLHLLDGEVRFQEKIRELRAEKDAETQKKAILLEKINQLQMEKDESLHKEATLNKKLVRLEKEKEALIVKEGSLQQTIKQFQREKEDHLQKEAALEVKIFQLEGEKDSWVQEKLNLEEKIKQLEREIESWMMKENLAKESIASLNNENAELRVQVLDLDQSRKVLVEEKQQLTDDIFSLQLKIGEPERTNCYSYPSTEKKLDEDVKDQLEAARALVEKLTIENSGLVEKVNELYGELDQRCIRKEDSLSVGSAPGAATAQYADISDSSVLMPNMVAGSDGLGRTAQISDSISIIKMMPVAGSNQLEDVMIEDQRNSEHANDKYNFGVAKSSEITEVDEIVQVPLEKIEVQEPNFEVAAEKTDVPLTDAPLIGAPFRLISFVARYVSGADLVNKNSGNSR